jgi:putative endonuclease
MTRGSDRRETARSGEDAAAAYLESRGFVILHRNLRIGRGEIDIIARRDSVVCFVEVKARRGRSHGHGHESVTPRKRAQLRRLGRAYAARDPGLRYRWDVASVSWDARDRPVVRYFENAFTETDA